MRASRIAEKYLRPLGSVRLRRSGKRGAEQLLHELRIRLSTRALHHLPHEEADDAISAAVELGYLVGMLRQHLVDGALDRAAIAHLRQPFRLYQCLGVGTGAQQAWQEFLRGV